MEWKMKMKWNGMAHALTIYSHKRGSQIHTKDAQLRKLPHSITGNRTQLPVTVIT